MKTWEMIKELTENPEKEFKRKADGLVIRSICERFNWEPGHTFLGVSDEWEEVKEPVDFMTAFQAFRSKHKNIYCMYQGERTSYYEDAKETYFFKEDEIQYGEWYIDD